MWILGSVFELENRACSCRESILEGTPGISHSALLSSEIPSHWNLTTPCIILGYAAVSELEEEKGEGGVQGLLGETHIFHGGEGKLPTLPTPTEAKAEWREMGRINYNRNCEVLVLRLLSLWFMWWVCTCSGRHGSGLGGLGALGRGDYR